MKATLPDKWIEASADNRTSLVAERTLQCRLGAVHKCLPLAAEKADEDIEHIHQLRVWTRRATAALALYEEMISRHQFSWLNKQLTRIRRAASDARNCDVLIERLSQNDSKPAVKGWLEAVKVERTEAQGEVMEVAERLAHKDRFAERIDKLLQKMGSRDSQQAGSSSKSFGNWAREHLTPLVERFFAAIPADQADDAALHQFRIRGKELRYALEILAGALPVKFRGELYPTLQSIQDRLGEVNDFATAMASLQRKIEADNDPKAQAKWAELLASEQAHFDQARATFWEWCTPQMLQDLRAGFEVLLSDSTDPAKTKNSPTSVSIQPTPQSDVVASSSLTSVVEQLPASDIMTKTRIVGELGETGLLLPDLVNEALSANDRAKYLMSLMQVAREHADDPEQVANDLKQERLACSVGDFELDSVIARSCKQGGDSYVIPGIGRIHQLLVDEVRRMLVPVLAQSGAPADEKGLANPYDERLQHLLSQTPSLAEDIISGEYLDRLTSGQRDAGDSLHLLVMDLHKELNRLQEKLTTEMIGGARVYGVREDDRQLIKAFMTGINQTRELKFDHPGLGTTATRSGQRLVIQNDIGMTDAHVLVIHVSENQVALTYSDIHIDRLIFFQNLFDRFAVRWEDTVSRRAAGLREDLYHLCLGTYLARDNADLQGYLSFLGSRLVFLIDWNRARKRLRKFAPRRVCVEVLRWAADQNLGHRGFLSLGGEHLIYDALQTAGRLSLPPGGQLSDVLGAERTAEFLKFTLQTASEGLRAGRSEFLIRDEVSAELRHYVETVHQGLLEVAAEHASLVVELALAARDMLLAVGPTLNRDLAERTLLRSKKWEHRADELVNRCRSARSRGDASGPVLDLLVVADDGADGLEEAIFWMSLLPSDLATGMIVTLNDLSDLALQGAQEYLKAVENARRLHRGSPREQVADFLEAVDRTLTVEHQTDEVHRRVQAGVMNFAGDYKHWHLVNGIADKLEEVTDALLRSVLVLRDYILSEVLRR